MENSYHTDWKARNEPVCAGRLNSRGPCLPVSFCGYRPTCPSQRQTWSLPCDPCLALPQLTPCLTPPCSSPSLPRCIFNSLFLTQHSQLCGPRPLLSVCFLFPTFNSLPLPLSKPANARGGLMSPSCLCSAGSGQGLLSLSLHADLASVEMNDQMTPEVGLCCVLAKGLPRSCSDCAYHFSPP